jgi:hypothetical protein
LPSRECACLEHHKINGALNDYRQHRVGNHSLASSTSNRTSAKLPAPARPARSLKSALRPSESGFAKIGQSRVPVFVNEDHAKTTILEQNRVRNYPDRT